MILTMVVLLVLAASSYMWGRSAERLYWSHLVDRELKSLNEAADREEISPEQQVWLLGRLAAISALLHDRPRRKLWE